MASSDQIAIYYARELTYGTPPGSGWKTLRYSNRDRFAGQAKTKRSNETRSDRMTGDMRRVGLDVNGGFDGDMSSGTWDDFLASVMGSEWASDVLKIGNKDITFSFDKHHRDIAGMNREHFLGMRVGKFGLNIPAEDILTVSFDLMGNGMSNGMVSSLLAASPTEVTSSEVFTTTDDYIDLGEVLFDGAAVAGCIGAFSLNIDNGLSPVPCVGSQTSSRHNLRTATISGQLEVYLAAETVPYYNKALSAKEPFSIRFPIADSAGNGYEFLLPRVFAPDAKKQDKSGDVVIQLNYEASFDKTESTSLKITRTTAAPEA